MKDLVFIFIDYIPLITSLSLGAWLLFYFLRMTMPLKTNSDAETLGVFFSYIEKANKSLEIFDDGNHIESYYSDDKLVEKLREKLKKNSKFTIDLHFNYRENLKINQLKQDFPERVRIRYKKQSQERPDHQWHFKIFDEGKYAYLSTHKDGSRDRKYFTSESTLWYLKKPLHPNVKDAMAKFNQQKVEFEEDKLEYIQ